MATGILCSACTSVPAWLRGAQRLPVTLQVSCHRIWSSATTAAEFITQMIRLRARAGISLRTLNLRSGGRLPPSTVSEALRRDRLPRLELVLDYARACGIRDDAIGEWERSWNVITNALRSDLTEGEVAQGSHSAVQVRRGLAGQRLR